jgi:hypothetical protein
VLDLGMADARFDDHATVLMGAESKVPCLSWSVEISGKVRDLCMTRARSDRFQVALCTWS